VEKDLNLRRLTSQDEIDFDKLDALPYGIILVDADGTILFYNQEEEEQAGRKRGDVLGKNFFTEVAPCAQVRDFYDQFREAVSKLGVIASFRFHYPLPGRPRDVQIQLASFRHEGQLLCLIIAADTAH
jgi:photoactive yellow protein